MNKTKIKEWWRRQVASLQNITNSFGIFKENLQKKERVSKDDKNRKTSSFITLLSTFSLFKKPEDVENEERDGLALFKLITWIFIFFPSVILLIITFFIWNTSIGKFVVIDAQIHTLLLFVSLILPVFTLKRAFIEIPAKNIGGVLFFGKPLITISGGPDFIVSCFQTVHEDNTNIQFEFKKGDEGHWAVLSGTVTSSLELLQTNEYLAEQREKLEKTPKDNESGLHAAATFKPNVSLTFKRVKSEYFFYLKNVPGDTPQERVAWLKEQVRTHALSCLNTEFKKRTYAMLIISMTKIVLNEALKNKMEDLIDDKATTAGKSGLNRLGINCINAEVTALNADEELHKAIDTSISATQTKESIIILAEASAKKIELEGKENNAIKRESGIIDANSFDLLLQNAKKAEIDPALIISLQSQLELAKNGKYTYITNTGNSKGNPKKVDNKVSAEMLVLADKITTALENLKPGSDAKVEEKKQILTNSKKRNKK